MLIVQARCEAQISIRVGSFYFDAETLCLGRSGKDGTVEFECVVFLAFIVADIDMAQGSQIGKRGVGQFHIAVAVQLSGQKVAAARKDPGPQAMLSGTVVNPYVAFPYGVDRYDVRIFL